MSVFGCWELLKPREVITSLLQKKTSAELLEASVAF